MYFFAFLRRERERERISRDKNVNKTEMCYTKNMGGINLVIMDTLNVSSVVYSVLESYRSSYIYTSYISIYVYVQCFFNLSIKL